MPQFALILPAAGTSNRFGGPTNKLFAPLGGIPVLARTLRIFLDRADVASVIIPTRSNLAEDPSLDPALKLALADPRIKICPGGETRAHSVRSGLLNVPVDIEWVAVHDAARPLVSQGLIDRTLAAATQHGAAVPALPVTLTIKEAIGPLPAKVQRTIPRDTLWSMQTPQVMRRKNLLGAFDRCPIPLDRVTDDVQLLELIGQEVWLVQGEESNLKITTPLDLRIAEEMCE